MSAVREVPSEIECRGVTLTLRGGRLMARPIDASPPDLAERARQHRAEIIELLKRRPNAEKDRLPGEEAERNARGQIVRRGDDDHDALAPGNAEFAAKAQSSEIASACDTRLMPASADLLEAAKSLIRTCREYGVGLRIESDATLVVESNGRAWRSLVRAIAEQADGVAQLIEARWDSNDA